LQEELVPASPKFLAIENFEEAEDVKAEQLAVSG
jgi:hypothetical protein